MVRYAILAHGAFDAARAKTGHSMLRYARLGWSENSVVCIVDRSQAGRDASTAVGEIGQGVPIVASVREALAHSPDAVAIGIAPVGGELPPEWRDEIAAALEAGLDIVSGLHTFLSDDPVLATAARLHEARIWDVRKYSREKLRIATGEGVRVPALVVTFVGTDCSSGKMTAAIELTREARRRGIDAGFVATGQTGIMVGADAGAPLDAIPSDFVAGAMEQCVLEAASKGREILFVEGQAALSHPAYSGVTLALLHGSFPDLLVLCGEPRRATLRFDSAIPFPVSSFSAERRLNEALAFRTGAEVAAIALLTRGLGEGEYADEVRKAEAETGLVADDVFRGGAPRILDGLLAAAERKGLWRAGRYAGPKLAVARRAPSPATASPSSPAAAPLGTARTR